MKCPVSPAHETVKVPASGNDSWFVLFSVITPLCGLVQDGVFSTSSGSGGNKCTSTVAAHPPGSRILLVTLVRVMSQSSSFGCACTCWLVVHFQFLSQMIESVKASVCLFSLR